MSSPTQQASQDHQAEKEPSKPSARKVFIRLSAQVQQNLESMEMMLICHFRDKHGLGVSVSMAKGLEEVE